MNNLSEIWQKINKTLADYIEEYIDYEDALRLIEEINTNNKLGVKIDAEKLLLSEQEYNEDLIISYVEEDIFSNSSYDDEDTSF